MWRVRRMFLFGVIIFIRVLVCIGEFLMGMNL